MADGIHWQSFGTPDGADVLALHGLHGHGGRWRDLAHRLPGLRVHAVDLRGHGRSPMLPPWTLEQHVDDVVAALDRAELDQVDLIGYSFGGTVAVHLADRHPARVRRLVLLDPAIGLDPDFGDAIARGVTVPDFATPRQAREHLAGAWPHAEAQALDDEVAEFLALGEDGQWRWRFSPPMIVTSCSEMCRPTVVPPVGVPTLLVCAAQNPRGTANLVAACTELTDRDITVTTLDSSHRLLVDAPAETAALIGRFLRH